ECFSEVQNALQCLEKYPATRSMIVMACYQIFFQLETFNVSYGATVSGLTDKQIKDLKVTQPQRIKIKWSETILEDVKRLQRLLFKPQIVIDANESVRDNEVEKIMLLSSSEILYLEEPFKDIEKVNQFNKLLKEKNIKYIIDDIYEYVLIRYFTALLARYTNYTSDITPQGYYFEKDIVAHSGIIKRGSIYFEPPLVNKDNLMQ